MHSNQRRYSPSPVRYCSQQKSLPLCLMRIVCNKLLEIERRTNEQTAAANYKSGTSGFHICNIFVLSVCRFCGHFSLSLGVRYRLDDDLRSPMDGSQRGPEFPSGIQLPGEEIQPTRNKRFPAGKSQL